MSIGKDRDGQPLNRSFNAARLSDRAVDELIGICKGVIFDGEVTQGEAKNILDWMEANRDAALKWPCNVLYRRLQEMLVDHVLDPEEQGELLELLADITGGGSVSLAERIAAYSSALPLCNPAPQVIFDGTLFCMTGKFVYGSRKQCEAIIREKGGEFNSNPTLKTDFLVIGSIGSTDWIHSTHGRKIEKAVEMRSKGKPIRIICEEHWVSHL